MDRLDQRVMWRLGIGLTAVYLLLTPGHLGSYDGVVLFQAAKRLLGGYVHFEPPLAWGSAGSIRAPAHSIGLSLVYALGLAPCMPFRAWLPSIAIVPAVHPVHDLHPNLFYTLSYLLCGVSVNPVITAATAALVYRVGRIAGFSRGWALAAALVYGLTSPAAVYAVLDFNQPLAALGLTGAVAGLLGSPMTRARALWAGAWFGLAVLARFEAIVLAAVFLWWVWRAPCERCISAIALLGPGLLAFATNVVVNLLRFGLDGPFGYPMGLFGGPWSAIPERTLGLLVSPVHGLLVFFPVALLAVSGWRRLSAAGGLMAGIVVATLALFSLYRLWWAGLSWGPRFLVPVLPLVVLGGTAAMALRPPSRPFRLLWGLLVAISGAVAVVGVIAPDPGRDSHAAQFEWTAAPGVRLVAVRPSPDLLWRSLARRQSALRQALDEEADPLWQWFAQGRRARRASRLAVATLAAATAWSGITLWRRLKEEEDASATGPGRRL